MEKCHWVTKHCPHAQVPGLTPVSHSQLLPLPNNIPWWKDAAFKLLPHRWMAKQETTETVANRMSHMNKTLWNTPKPLPGEMLRSDHGLKGFLHGVEIQWRAETRTAVPYIQAECLIYLRFMNSVSQSTIQPSSQWKILGENFVRASRFQRKMSAFWKTVGIRTSGTSKSRVCIQFWYCERLHLHDW